MKRKKIGALLLMSTMVLSLVACGNEEKPDVKVEEDFTLTVERDETPSTQASETVAPEETQTQETVVEEENREGMYRSELTNEWIDETLKNQRPIAVMVDNEKIALPHYGLTEADVVYEIMNSTANNRITRLMAVVKDWGKITQFGSIRSARQTNFMLAAEWNAVVCHDGGPYYIDEWVARDYTNNFSGTFGRVDNGKAREYTEYICEGDLEKNFKNKGYSTEYNEFYPGQHFTFAASEVDLSTQVTSIDATHVELPFYHNDSMLDYNKATGTYDYSEYGKQHVDPLHDNAVLSFENVILQDCTYAKLDANGYLIYNCIDVSNRDGYYLTKGKAIPIIWIKESETAPTKFYNKATGEEIELNTGKTYIALVPSDTWDEVVIQ